MTVWTLSACIVENVVWPVFIAWNRVIASSPRTSPTRMYSGRCRSADRSRSYIVMSASPIRSRVTEESQFSCYSDSSRVSSMVSTFDRGGMNIDTAFIDVVFPAAVPPAKTRLLLCSIASHRKASIETL